MRSLLRIFFYIEERDDKMTDEQVQNFVEELSITHFNWPFLHKAYFNPRLKTTGGRYLLQTHHIELNRKLYDRFGLEELRGIILHELCHYHLHIRGMGYRHADVDFKCLLQKVGAPRFCSSIVEQKNKKVSLHMYHCVQCRQVYKRKRKMDVKKYCCSKCRGAIIYHSSKEM